MIKGDSVLNLPWVTAARSQTAKKAFIFAYLSKDGWSIASCCQKERVKFEIKHWILEEVEHWGYSCDIRDLPQQSDFFQYSTVALVCKLCWCLHVSICVAYCDCFRIRDWGSQVPVYIKSEIFYQPRWLQYHNCCKSRWCKSLNCCQRLSNHHIFFKFEILPLLLKIWALTDKFGN